MRASDVPRARTSITHREDHLRSHYEFTVGEATHRGRPAGLALSVLLHIGAVLLLLIPLRHDFARVLAMGAPLAKGGGGGGGSGRVAYITLPAPAASAPAPVTVSPPRETPPPVPVTAPVTPPQTIPPPAPVEDTPVPTPVAPQAAASGDSAGGVGPGQGGGAGGGTGGGLGPGVGPGSGPGTGPGVGEGGRGRPAEIRHMPIPPDNEPKDLRGTQLQVTFWVDESGRAVKVEVIPAIRDRKYAQKFAEAMLSYRFRPALGPDGRPIASTATMTVSY